MRVSSNVMVNIIPVLLTVSSAWIACPACGFNPTCTASKGVLAQLTRIQALTANVQFQTCCRGPLNDLHD
ncbi:hypothetical protein ACYZUC_01370 [Pseudomonas sp. GT1P32]